MIQTHIVNPCRNSCKNLRRSPVRTILALSPAPQALNPNFRILNPNSEIPYPKLQTQPPNHQTPKPFFSQIFASLFVPLSRRSYSPRGAQNFVFHGQGFLMAYPWSNLWSNLWPCHLPDDLRISMWEKTRFLKRENFRSWGRCIRP